MKKRITQALTILSLMAIVSSCSVSNDVASNRRIQKRKYNKGFFVEKNNTNGLAINKNKNKVDNSSVSTQKEVSEYASNTNNESQKTYSYEKETVYNSELEVNTNTFSDEIISNDNHQINQEVVETENEEVTVKLSKKDIKTNLKSVIKSKNKISPLGGDDMMILLVILALLIPFVAVGIKTDWDIKKVVIALLLTILFVLPGIIYALLVVFDKI